MPNIPKKIQHRERILLVSWPIGGIMLSKKQNTEVYPPEAGQNAGDSPHEIKSFLLFTVYLTGQIIMQNYSEKSKTQPLAVAPLGGRLVATVLSTIVENVRQINLFMQNKANFCKAKIIVSSLK